MRRYNRWHSRFDQPDPYNYDFANPQSFNRYAYVQNDPVNFVDPSGMEEPDIIRIYTNEPFLPGGPGNFNNQSGTGDGGGGDGDGVATDQPDNEGRDGGGNPQNTQQPVDVTGVRDNIAEWFKNPDCRNYITNLITGISIWTPLILSTNSPI